jgi:hypothetical protein
MTIDNHLDKYMEVQSRQQKSRIVNMIVGEIKGLSEKDGGSFVRKVRLEYRY